MKKEVNNKLKSNSFEELDLSHLAKRWLTGNDVCRILGISKRTLQSYRRGILPFAQIGRKIYYKSSDIDEFLNRHYIKAVYQKGGAA